MKICQKLLSIPICIAVLFSLGFKGCGSSDLNQRVARAISAIPSTAKVLFPDASPTTLETLDKVGKAFKGFADSPDQTTFRHAEEMWEQYAKPELLKFKNQRVNLIVMAVDALLSQVHVDESAVRSVAAPVRVEFNEDDVRKLEALVSK